MPSREEMLRHVRAQAEAAGFELTEYGARGGDVVAWRKHRAYRIAVCVPADEGTEQLHAEARRLAARDRPSETPLIVVPSGAAPELPGAVAVVPVDRLPLLPDPRRPRVWRWLGLAVLALLAAGVTGELCRSLFLPAEPTTGEAIAGLVPYLVFAAPAAYATSRARDACLAERRWIRWLRHAARSPAP